MFWLLKTVCDHLIMLLCLQSPCMTKSDHNHSQKVKFWFKISQGWVNNSRIKFLEQTIPLNLFDLWGNTVCMIWVWDSGCSKWQGMADFSLPQSDWVRYGSLWDPGFTVRSVSTSDGFAAVATHFKKHFSGKPGVDKKKYIHQSYTGAWVMFAHTPL